MSTELQAIQWSGGAIAGLVFSAVVFLIWLSIVLGSRRGRINREAQARVVPEITDVLASAHRYTVHVKAMRAFDGLRFVGRYTGDLLEPLRSTLVFERDDGRRVMIRAEQIRFIEQN